MPAHLLPGATVALVGSDGTVSVARVPDKGETVEVKGLGVLAHEAFAALELGGTMRLGTRAARVLPLTPELVFRALSRRAQVITPQDAARIAYGCAVGPGTTVVEGGSGTGALTAYLAFLVGTTGRVHSYELRQDHLRVARSNVRMADVEARVTFHEGDLADAQERGNAFVADVADPARVVPAAARCVLPGGRACFYTPLVSQVEAVHRALADAPFEDARTLEQMERDWVVHERGSRPSFEVLGHTGFLTFATRVL